MTNKSSQVLLALETCTNICSVALYDGEKIYSKMTEVARSHSKTILPLVSSLLEEANLSIDEVNAVVCARGPGSFTGVRIGIGVAKGLAYGQDIPIIPVSPLQAIAYRMIAEIPTAEKNRIKSVMALLDARMGEVYASTYDITDGLPLLIGSEVLTTVEMLSIGDSLVGGTGALEYRDYFVSQSAEMSEVVYPLAADMISIAQIEKIPAVSAADFSPVYLRDKVTY